MTAPQPVTLFISDLHLSAEQPRVVANFFRFLESTARRAHALYILGDLFDYWVGDDDLGDPFHRSVADALAGLAANGTQLYFMHGNRDFLIGPEFARASRCTILSDPTVIELHGMATLLTHGDSLCTDDVEYQRFRALVRTAQWQKTFLAKPLTERRRAALGLRAQSEQAKHGKSIEIMDVSAVSVMQLFRAYSVTRVIHGHTHRPARHEHAVDQVARERWVLSDWRETAPYLQCNASGCDAAEI